MPCIYINYDSTIEGVVSFAHELGHAYSFWKYKQYFSAPEFMKELSALMFERQILNYCERTSKGRIIKEYELNRFKNLFVRQFNFVNFEYQIRENEEREICKIYRDILNEAYGSFVSHDKLEKYEYLKVSNLFKHAYVSEAYVISYLLTESNMIEQSYYEYLLGMGKESREEIIKAKLSDCFRYVIQKYDNMVGELENGITSTV